MKSFLRAALLLMLLFVGPALMKATSAITVLVAQAVPLCPGSGGGGSINLTPSGGTAPYTFLWNDGSTAQNRTNLASGNYWVIVTDSTNATDSLSFIINNPASFNISKTVTDEKCGGQNIGTVTLNVTGGTAPYTFSWSNGDTSQNLNHLTAAVYYVTITDAHACPVIDSANVTQPPGVGITSSVSDASCGGNNGSVSITVQYGNPSYTFLWNDGDTAQNRNNLAQGTYDVTVTDSIGCSASATEVVPQLPGSMNINSTSTQPSCFGGNNGAINITSVIGGTGPFTYAWSDSATAQNNTGLTAGIYDVTVTSGTGCTVSASYNLSQPSQIDINLTPISLTCFGSSNGAINTSVNGGSSPYHFNWNDGSTSQDRIDLASGTYTLTVTDTKSCTDTASVFVSQPTQVMVTVVPTDITCAGGPTGSVKAIPSGGAGSYSFWWGGGHVLDSLSNINAGNYTVIVTDGNGCTATATGTVAAYTPVSASSSQVNVACYGTNTGSINITPNNGWGPFSYLWNNGDTTASIDSLTAGTYTITVTDTHLCTATKSVAVTQPPFPITVNSNISDVVCHGDSTGGIIITPINGAPPYNYHWGDGSSFKTITNLPAGNYYLTVTDNSGCSTTMTFTVTQPQAITITHVDNNVTCFGLNTGSIQLGATGGYAPLSFNWGGGIVTQNRTNLVAGTYIVTVSDNYSCTATDTSIITQPTKISINTTTTNVACYGANTGGINLSVGGGTGPYSYNWGGGVTSQNRTNLNAGAYQVTVTDSASCTGTASATISQPGSGTHIVPTIVNATCNGGANGSISLNVTGGTSPYSFDWGGGITTPGRNNLTAGTYIVVVTDSAGCTSSDTSVVSQSTTLNVSAAVVNAACNGAADGAITLTVTGGIPNYTFDWGGGITTQNRTNLIAGTYTVTVTDSASCSKTITSTITQSGSISITPAVTNVSCYDGNNGAINLTVTGGIAPYTYNWGGGITTLNRTGLSAGNYSVIVTDSAGCTLSNSSTLTQPAQLNVNASIVNVLCSGGNNGSINLAVSGGVGAYTFDWGGGINSQNIDSLVASNYVVTVTDSNLCTSVDTFIVNQPSQLSVSLTPVNPACYGQMSGRITSLVSGGTPGYTYNWSDNFVSPNLTNIDTGSYTLTVSDINLCTAVGSALISQPNPIVISPTVVNATCFGYATGSIYTNASGGTGSYAYLWSDSSSNSDLTNITSGTYQVTVTDDNMCTVSASATITQPTALNISANKTDVTCFGGNNGSIDISVMGGNGSYNYTWSNGANTANADSLTVGNYTVVVKDAENCSISTSANISQPSQIIISADSSNVSCGGVNNGSITLSVSGGTPTYSYAWNNGDTTQQINNLAVNTYMVTVTDASFCTANKNISVIQSPGITVSATHTDYECINTGTINLTVTGGSLPYSYSWSDSATSANRINLTAGTYEVTVTDAGSCSATAGATISQVPPLSSNITKIDVTCYGEDNGAAHINISNGTPPYNIQWSNGDETKDISGLSANSYNVTVTDANNCNLTTVTVINQPTQLQLSDSIVLVNCYGNNNGSISINVTGGIPAYVYNWSNGSASQSISNVTAGTYSIVVSDSNHCSAMLNNIIITQPSQIIANANATPAGCSGQTTGSIQLSVSGGAGNYSFSWSNQATTQNLNAVAAGNYTVTITDSKNCTTVTNADVTLSTQLKIYSYTQNASCAGVQNGSINVSMISGTPAYSYNWSNGSNLENLTDLAAGQYSVTITDANNCSLEADFNIANSYELQVQITPPSNATIIPGESVQLSATVNEEHGNNFTWTPSNDMSCSTCPSTYVVTSQTGSYTVSVVDVNGCRAVDSITLNVGRPDLYIPNAFSPNNDGNNDVFKIYGNLEAIQMFQLAIFDGWGEQVYGSNDPNFAWDGMYKGKPAPVGVYVYIITTNLADGSVKNYKGSITLVK